MTVTAVTVQNADGTTSDPVADGTLKVCILYTEQPDPTGATTRYAGIDLRRTDTSGMAQDLSTVYPKGTQFAITAESSGGAPLLIVGAIDDPAVTFDGQKVVIAGRSVEQKLAHSYTTDRQPDCAAGTTTIGSKFSSSVILEPAGSGQASETVRNYAGSYFGSNAQVIGTPTVTKTADGSPAIGVRVAGCGDGDPQTIDGFFKGFLSAKALTAMGLDATLLAQPAAVVDEMMQLQDNGAAQPQAEFTPAAASSGIELDYAMSFSAHSLTAAIDKPDVKRAERCTARGGTLQATSAGLVCSGGSADRAAPALKLSVARQKLAAVLKGGLAVGYRSSEACRLTARLTYKGQTVGSATARRTSAGSGKLTIRLSAPGRKALARARKATVRVVVIARDAAGNARTRSATVTLR